MLASLQNSDAVLFCPSEWRCRAAPKGPVSPISSRLRDAVRSVRSCGANFNKPGAGQSETKESFHPLAWRSISRAFLAHMGAPMCYFPPSGQMRHATNQHRELYRRESVLFCFHLICAPPDPHCICNALLTNGGSRNGAARNQSLFFFPFVVQPLLPLRVRTQAVTIGVSCDCPRGWKEVLYPQSLPQGSSRESPPPYRFFRNDNSNKPPFCFFVR